MKKMILAAAAAIMSGFAGNAAPFFEAKVSDVAVEGAPIKGLSADARAELERHLALVGAMGTSRPTVAALTIVLGEKAPGAGEPEAHTSYAKLVGDRLYLWGDDKNCPGTLFAVYGFLENILGVVWPMPGDANIVAPPATSLDEQPITIMSPGLRFAFTQSSVAASLAWSNSSLFIKSSPIFVM